ncbi:MAG: hypothetical protein AAFR74_01135, partial [Pseudomonadota bacterium]
ALQKVHPAYEEDASLGLADDRDVVVTLLGSNLPAAYLDEAEPSLLMERASRWWQRLIFTLRFALVLALLGGYPLMMVLSHKVDSSPVPTPSEAVWNSPETAITLTLIGREETGAGWAMDQAWWHPQARLTALPAWQEGLTSALSDYILLTAQTVTPVDLAPDADLMAAGRLLAPVSDSPAEARMRAAAQALQRYDGRLSRSLAAAPVGIDAVQQELDLFIAWGIAAELDLRAASGSDDGWPASRADIETIYKARGQAHVAAELLNGSFIAEPTLTTSRDVAEAKENALIAWRKAANFNPLFVSSPGATEGFLSDHPATLAWYIAEAKEATIALKTALNAQAKSTPELLANVTP